MSDINFLYGFVIFSYIIYLFINTYFSDWFKERKLYIIAASVLGGIFLITAVSIKLAQPNLSSKAHDKIDKEEKLKIDPKEIRDIIKQLEDPEERQKLVRNLNILSAQIDDTNKDNK